MRTTAAGTTAEVSEAAQRPQALPPVRSQVRNQPGIFENRTRHSHRINLKDGITRLLFAITKRP